MERDIDQIIQRVKQQSPDIKVHQLHKTHSGDDDGIWWFWFPGIEGDIQIESSFGNCPFIAETNELCCENARKAETIEEAVSMILDYLNALKNASLEVEEV